MAIEQVALNELLIPPPTCVPGASVAGGFAALLQIV
jgi:hypothetical protein